MLLNRYSVTIIRRVLMQNEPVDQMMTGRCRKGRSGVNIRTGRIAQKCYLTIQLDVTEKATTTKNKTVLSVLVCRRKDAVTGPKSTHHALAQYREYNLFVVMYRVQIHLICKARQS